MMIDGKDRLVYFSSLFTAYLQSKVDDYISPTDTMVNEWYMLVGESGARAVYAACVARWTGKVSSVLDCPAATGASCAILLSSSRTLRLMPRIAITRVWTFARNVSVQCRFTRKRI